jgi:hypothetical protein
MARRNGLPSQLYSVAISLTTCRRQAVVLLRRPESWSSGEYVLKAAVTALIRDDLDRASRSETTLEDR